MYFDPSHELADSFKALPRHSLRDRVLSIFHDSEFVRSVQQQYDLPLIANDRCGTWYVDPPILSGRVYFKSTDGHTNFSRFSTRRLNLHLLQFGSCIIVDSTRKGKKFPDALSKTIPIWIYIINLHLAKVNHLPPPELVLYPHIPPSEVTFIEAQIPGFIEDFNSLDLDDSIFLGKKLMRPIWVHPGSSMGRIEGYSNIVLLSASSTQTMKNGFEYVQGAADDQEMWSEELTPEILWSLKDSPEAIWTNNAKGGVKGTTIIRITGTNIYLAESGVQTEMKSIDLRINGNYPCPTGKKGSKVFESILTTLMTYDIGSGVVIIDDEDCKSRGTVIAMLLLRETVESSKAGFLRLLARISILGRFDPSRRDLIALNKTLLSSTS